MSAEEAGKKEAQPRTRRQLVKELAVGAATGAVITGSAMGIVSAFTGTDQYYVNYRDQQQINKLDNQVHELQQEVERKGRGGAALGSVAPQAGRPPHRPESG